MEIDIKNNIEQYIVLLSDVLKTDNKLAKIEYETWIPNCIECLKFALDNEQLLIDKPNLYKDNLTTLSLLYNWIFEEKSWAYIELYQKFRKIYTGKECGEAFKILFNRMSKSEIKPLESSSINYTNSEGKIKSLSQILNDLSQQWKLGLSK